MKTLTILLASALLWSAQDTSTYTNPDLNLTFSYPKTWKLTTKSNQADAFIPIAGTEEYATLEIRSVPYFSEPDGWQTVQADLAKSTHREMVKQWQEELLGVPLLLTRTQYTKDGTDTTRQSGLVYSASRKKLLYHLTAPTKNFDQVEGEFKGALQSLRTIDGVMPKPEVPGREKGAYNPDIITRPPLIMRAADGAKKEIVKAPVTVPCSAGGQNLMLHLPQGWTAAKGEGDKFTLKHAGVSVPVVLTVQSSLDSDPAERALIKATTASLSGFKRVDLREDTRAKPNRAGAILYTVLRNGTTDAGQMITSDAAGQTGDCYWLMSAQWTSPVAYKSDMKLINTLIQEMSVEPAQ